MGGRRIILITEEVDLLEAQVQSKEYGDE